MLQSRRFTENLQSLAADAYEVSGRLCDSCRDLHSLWPYIRLSRASTGVEAQASNLETLLADLFSRGLRRVLIAGSADTGLLALAARAGAAHGPSITVLDICETPLELCRRFAKQWSLPVETIRQDLLDLDVEKQFDVILVHGTLHFISADRRADALSRMQHAIRPAGRLVLMFNTSRPVAGDIASEGRAGYGKWVIDELRRVDIALPDADAAFCERLNAHARRRESREGAFAEPGDVEALLSAAGFRIDSCARIDVALARPVDSFISRMAKRRYMAIAEPKLSR